MSDGTFLLCITGQIEFVDFILAPAGSSWHCKYELFHGPDWKIIGGLESGLSQVAHIVNNGDKIVFNFPIQIQFKTTNPFGCKFNMIYIIIPTYNSVNNYINN